MKRQSHKMVKRTQTVRRQFPTNCLSVFDHFVILALKGLTFVAIEPIYFGCSRIDRIKCCRKYVYREASVFRSEMVESS